MRMTRMQRNALAMSAIGLGLMTARALGRRRAYDFGGKSVLITGGSRGLGLVLARQLACEGARLTLVARDADELIITAQARLAVLARTLGPGLVASAMSIANRLLPSPAEAQGDVSQPGSVSGLGWVRSVLTAPTYAAARRNNEL